VVVDNDVAHALDLDPLDPRLVILERFRQLLDDRGDLDDLLAPGCPLPRSAQLRGKHEAATSLPPAA
jgi:hypothetical protein